MAYERREIVGGAVPATVTSGLGDLNPGTFTIDVTTGWPTGTDSKAFYIVVDRGLATEEKMKCSARAGNTVTVATRGADGSTAAVHTPGSSKAEVIATAVDLDEANYAVSQTVGKVTTKGDLIAATGNAAFARVATGGSANDNQVLLANSGATAGVSFGPVVPQSISGLSGIGKGEIVTASGANELAKLSSGTTNYVLQADSTTSTGMKWAQVGTLNISDNAVTAPKISGVSGIAKGGIVTASASDTLALRSVGTDGQILKADSTQASGLAWMDHTVTQSQVTFDNPATYTPEWGNGEAADSAYRVVVGDDGTITGRKLLVGRMVWVQIVLTFGTDTNKGGDSSSETPRWWTFTLPYTAVTARQAIPGFIHNADGTDYRPVTGVISTGDSTKIALIALPSGGIVTKATPYSWNSGARIVLSGWYEKAA